LLGVDDRLQYGYTASMKATIDIPDALYRGVKARSALAGRSVRDVTIELYRRWLAETPSPAAELAPEAAPEAAEAWLASWEALGKEVDRAASDDRTTREILVADRR
jgi:hypothetical protein